MTGLDANVLLRFFIKDDPKQSAQARAVLNALTSDDPGWVGLAVVQELVWVLTSTYHASRSDVFGFLEKLLSANEIVVENADVVQEAIRVYGATKVTFSDCLIVASASAAGCSQTLTFDRQAAKSAGITLVP